MKARSYLILVAVAILVPVTVIARAGLSMLLDWERESRIRSVESNARATALRVDREVAAAQAALHGGTVAAASAGAGAGSTFTLRLPLAAAPARAPDPQPDAASATSAT